MTNVEIISASAGTGKTYRLAELLLETIRSGTARPEAVVATTFTNKAAAELRERVRRRLLSAGLADEARRLGAARIGTVNGICGQLVGDFAFELGLPPDLRVLDETEAKVELDRALSNVLDDGRLRDLGDLKDRMVDLEWTDDVRAVLGRARENNLTSDQLRECADRSIATFADLLVPLEDEVSPESLRGELATALVKLLAAFPAPDDTTKLSKDVLDDCRIANDRIKNGGTLSWHKWLSLAGTEPGKKSRELFAPVKQVAERHCHSSQLRIDCHRTIRAVFELAADALAVYAEHKANMGAIDFVDQEVLALEVLTKPELVERLRGSIDLVLVDEFQDTSPLQLAIFLALAELAPRSVWVGDQKQAIFGFRGTDPALMDAAITALLGADEPETLTTSYRSRRQLVALTSDVFVDPFGSRSIPETRVRIDASDPGTHVDLDPCLELWQLKSRNGDQDVAAIAAGVRDLVEGGRFRIRDRERDGESRVARAGDVAVLCRKNATCVALATELASLGVRASVERAGLFATPEARVLLAGLRLWADSSNVLSRAELARRIGYPEDASAWLEAALASSPVDSGGNRFETVDEVRRLASARTRNPVAGALEAFDETTEALGLRELCRSWGDAGERLSNVEAVRAHVVRYGSLAASVGRAATPWGLIAYLEEVQEDELDTRSAFEGADAVTVSTWHRAKGLEWPIVVLLDIASPPPASAFGIHVESERVEIDLASPLEGRWVRYWPNPYQKMQKKAPLHSCATGHPASARVNTSAEYENLRLAYVGWTRARDCVVLASRTGKAGAGLLQRLGSPDKPLTVPPMDDGTEFVDLDWAGKPVRARVRHCAPAAARPRAVGSETTYVATGPREFPPRWVQPSAAHEILESPGALATSETIGTRIALSGSPSMDLVGSAIHGFLAADHRELTPGERLSIASGLLDRWDVADALAPAALLTASDALHAWVARNWPGAIWHRELPILHKLPTGSTVRGTCDLALETPAGWVIIDHKSFPGSTAEATSRAQTHAPQLAAYAAAVRASTNQPTLSCWIHLPVTGHVAKV